MNRAKILSSTLLLLFTHLTQAQMTNPATDVNFLILPDGRNLKNIVVSGRALSLTHGTGMAFSAIEQAAYRKVKEESQTKGELVHWVLMDLDNHTVIDQSLNTDRRQFGASVSKIFVGATLTDKQNGKISTNQLQLMTEMIVVSSNTAWSALQTEIGDGNFGRGMEPNFNFTQRMGYVRTRGWSGTWNGLHGNELTAKELVEFLYDTYHGRYPGAAIVWKIMHTGRTGGQRAKKYIPADIFVGGKTGTYDGQSPMSEGPTNVRVRHQVIVFNIHGREYGLAILAGTGSEETAALLAGGLIREYTGLQ